MRARPLKRLRLVEPVLSKTSVEFKLPETCTPAPSSAMLQQFKNLAQVTTSVPVSVSRLGTEHFVVASLGRQFAVYCTDKLHIRFLSPVLSHEITALVASNELTFVAIGSSLEVFHRFIRLSALSTPHSSPITQLYLFGDLLVTICQAGRVCLFSTSSLSSRITQAVLLPLVAQLPLEGVTAVTAVPTYTNKLLFGLASGVLVLFNVNSMKIVHKYQSIDGASDSAAITCLTSSRALDVVAVAAGARVHLVNTKTDEVIKTFTLDKADKVTGVQFLTIAAANKEILAVSSTGGTMALFDLVKGVFVGQMDVGVGGGGVTSLCGLDTLPLLLTADEGNGLSVWVFDRTDGVGRVLRERRGFRGGITKAVAISETEVVVASDAGEVGKVSLIQNQQNVVFSAKNKTKYAVEDSKVSWTPYHRALPAVVDLAVNTLRKDDWPTVVSVHSGETRAFVWSLAQGAMVCRMLKAGEEQLTACVISECGNFVHVGSSGGQVAKFNLQSCQQRGGFQVGGGRVQALHWRRGGGVVAVSSGEVKDELFGSMTSSVRKGRVIGKSALAAGSAFVAVTYVDGDVAVIDLATDTEVRFIPTEGIPVAALTWSDDNLHLAFSLVSGDLKIFDIQANALKDQAKLATPAVSMTFVDSNLVVCRGTRSVQLLNNLLKLNGLCAPCPLRPVPLEALDADSDSESEPQGVASAEVAKAVEAVTEGLIRRSASTSVAQQRQLLHLAEIKSRNTVEVTKAKDLPFFLPTSTGVDGAIKFSKSLEPLAPDASSDPISTLARVGKRKLEETTTSALGEFFALLAVADWRGVAELLKAQSASGVHVLLGTLSISEAMQMVQFFLWLVQSGQDADLGQVWLTLFLKEHGADLPSVCLVSLADLVSQKEHGLWSLGNRVNCFARMILSADLLL